MARRWSPVLRHLLWVALVCLLVFNAPARGAPSPTELVVYTGVGFGELLERTVSKTMLERHNTKVVWEEQLIQQAYTKIVAQGRNPEVSVSIVNPEIYRLGQKAGVWADIDPRLVPNLAQVFPAAMKAYPGQQAVALQANTVGVAYRTDIFMQRGLAPPTGYTDLWRPEFKGRVGLTSSTAGTGLRALLVWARMNRGDETNPDPGFQMAKDLVQKQQVAFFATSSAHFNSAMQQGEIWIGVQFSEGALQFRARGGPVGYVYPKEGVSLSVAGVTVVKGAPHQELAQRFVNLLIDREFQTEMARIRWAVPIRPGISLPPEYTRVLPLSPDQWTTMVVHDWDLYGAKFNEWNQRWLREIERKQ
jgi:putative spermidine/putrescine transport system substrate-binding protein